MGSHPSDLLPWYVNGALDEVEHQQVETHITHCTSCRHEIAELERLRTRVKNIGVQGQSPGELGLARLKRRIQSETSKIESSSPRRWLMPVLAAAAVIIVAQAGLMLNMNATHRQNMQLMSAPAAGDIQIRFVADARAEQVDALLQSIHGQIVAGPGALGVYHIRINAGASGRKNVGAAIRKLRTRSDIVQFVAGEGE